MSYPVYNYSATSAVVSCVGGNQQSSPMDEDDCHDTAVRAPIHSLPHHHRQRHHHHSGAIPKKLAANGCADQVSGIMMNNYHGGVSQCMEQRMLEGRLVIPDASSSSSLPSSMSSSMTSSSSSLSPMSTNNNNNFVHQPVFTLDEYYGKVQEALTLEPKYQPSLYLPQESQDGGEITIGTRDGAAHVLRCLKVWYELSNDVLFTAINLVDRFLTKMKVRSKHMACISVSSLHLAVKQLGLPIIDTEDLVVISQCRCTSRDLERMADIIANKLGVQMQTSPVTALTFIRLFYYIFLHGAEKAGIRDIFESCITLADLEMRAEILSCDANCASIRASELALVLICVQMDAQIEKNSAIDWHLRLVDYAIKVQQICRIPDDSFFHSHKLITAICSQYNGQSKMPYKQRLVWKLSSRTLRVLRPTDRLTSYLPTIAEHNATNANNNIRFRTGSVSSEDGEDWPTSPVVAVCEQC